MSGAGTGIAKEGDVDPIMVGVIVLGGFGLLVLAYFIGLLLWFSGQVTGLLVNGQWPDAGASEALKILIAFPGNLTNPAGAWPEHAQAAVGPSWLIYPLFVLLVAPICYAGFLLVRMIIRFRRHREFRRLRLGFADGGEVSRLLSGRAVKKKAKSVRPSYKSKKGYSPLEVGYYLGKDIRSRQKLYCSVEDVMLVVAPPRQGKDVHFCIPNIIDAMGPCVATTTRADMFAATVSSREQVGKVWVFDPNKMTNWPDQMRWSPVNGCEDPLIALNRASAFVAGAGVGEGVQNASYWTGIATAILRCYLHAAALAGRTITDVVRWSTQPANPEPIQILRAMELEGRAAGGWAGELESNAATDGETRGNMWSGVRRALDCFADPDVLASCSPGPDDVFNVAEFVRGRNTMYVLGKEKKNGSVAPLVTAMMEDLFDQVRKVATKMPNSRIDPPLTVELNEVAHIAPMPNLPSYMGDSGGFSIALHVYLQSLAQARSKWGNDDAATMWDTAAIRVIMGGAGTVSDLRDISELMGEVDEKTRSVTKGVGGRSTNISKQKKKVLSIDELRTLEFGHAVVIARAARPVESVLTPWWKRKDAKEIGKGKDRVEKVITGEGSDKGDANTTLAVPRSQTLGQHPLAVGASVQGAPSSGGTVYGGGSASRGNGQAAEYGTGFPAGTGHPISGIPEGSFDIPQVSQMPTFDPANGVPGSGMPTSSMPSSDLPASGPPISTTPATAPGSGVPVSAQPPPQMPGPYPPQGPPQSPPPGNVSPVQPGQPVIDAATGMPLIDPATGQPVLQQGAPTNQQQPNGATYGKPPQAGSAPPQAAPPPPAAAGGWGVPRSDDDSGR